MVRFGGLRRRFSAVLLWAAGWGLGGFLPRTSAEQAGAQEILLLHPAPYEEIDWRSGSLRSFGEAAEPAPRGWNLARQEAEDSMMALLALVRIDAGETLGQRLRGDSALEALLREKISQVAHSRRASRSDGQLTVRLELKFLTLLSPLVAPKFGNGKPLAPLLCPLCGNPWPRSRPYPPGPQPFPNQEHLPTGVMLHVGDLRFEPALFPRLLNLNGSEVYGPAFAERERALTQGLVRYVEAGDPSATERVGEHPLHLRPLGVRGACDFVVSDEDVQHLHGDARMFHLLQECRVVVTTAPFPVSESAP